jgi:hypothetical protein
VLPGFPFSPAGPSVAVEPLGEVDYAPGHPHEHEGELARNCADERIVGHADSFPMIGDGPPAPGVLLQCLLDRAPEPAHDAGMSDRQYRTAMDVGRRTGGRDTGRCLNDQLLPPDRQAPPRLVDEGGFATEV